MITSPDMLRRDTVNTLGQINSLIQDVEDRAKQLDIPSHEMRDANGTLELSALLLAKVTAISTLVQLNYNIQSRGQRS